MKIADVLTAAGVEMRRDASGSMDAAEPEARRAPPPARGHIDLTTLREVQATFSDKRALTAEQLQMLVDVWDPGGEQDDPIEAALIEILERGDYLGHDELEFLMRRERARHAREVLARRAVERSPGA